MQKLNEINVVECSNKNPIRKSFRILEFSFSKKESHRQQQFLGCLEGNMWNMEQEKIIWIFKLNQRVGTLEAYVMEAPDRVRRWQRGKA